MSCFGRGDNVRIWRKVAEEACLSDWTSSTWQALVGRMDLDTTRFEQLITLIEDALDIAISAGRDEERLRLATVCRQAATLAETLCESAPSRP